MASYDQTQPAQVVERARDATILINNKVQLSADLLEQLPKLKLVAIAATGTDCIDKKFARERGIAITNIRGYAAATVPEHTMAQIRPVLFLQPSHPRPVRQKSGRNRRGGPGPGRGQAGTCFRHAGDVRCPQALQRLGAPLHALQ